MTLHLLKLVWNRKRANALIVVEILLSFLVLFAVLTGFEAIRSNWTRPVGYDWRNVWDVSMEFSGERNLDATPDLQSTVRRMLDEARSFDEVEAVAGSSTPPYAFSTWERTKKVNGRDVAMIVDEVTDDFPKVMKVKLIAGTWFGPEHDGATYPPIVIDTNTAREVFGGGNVVGRLLDEDLPKRVVGVVEEYRKDGEPSSSVNMVFERAVLPLSATTGAPKSGERERVPTHLLVRVRPGTRADFEETLVSRLRAVAPDVQFRIRRLDQMRSNAIRFRLAPLALGAVVGVFLVFMVALGLTGVLWQNVTRRTRELGVRRALGASGPAVHRQILLEVVLLTTMALAAGALIVVQLPILGALSIVTRAAFLTGFAEALAIIYLLTLACALYPSWLASRMTPAEALRYE